jgi:hypothetical protein
MENSSRVAMLHGIENLKKDSPGLVVVSDVITVLGDSGKQVAFWTILENNKSAFRRVQHFLHRNNVGVATRLEMQFDLAILERPLPLIEAEFVQCLDCIEDVRSHITGLVNGSIGTDAKNFG